MSDEETPKQKTSDVYEEPEVMPIMITRTNSYSPKEPIRQLRESK